MTNVSIRDVPEEVVNKVRSHAAGQGKSLQAYVRELLERDARTTPADHQGTRGTRLVRRLQALEQRSEYAHMSTDEYLELIRG
ncbi:FitA-like ribbon-helix-helix domain-containing protein [Nocardiopsis protaetiae]|uniref:FitA-like ribbon-helix-helix domain-containing protein n=1 Tax=Nocardiopsis protaetiae TaxID=3382270 RepID=UPI00387B38D8